MAAKIKACSIMQGRDEPVAAAAMAPYLGVVLAEGAKAVTEARARKWSQPPHGFTVRVVRTSRPDLTAPTKMAQFCGGGTCR